MSRIAVIFSTTRENRFADKPAKWVVDKLQRMDDVELDVIDLRDHPLPFYDSAVPPARAPRQYATPELAALGARIDAADAFIVLTAEFEMAPVRHGVNILPDLMVAARQSAEPFDVAIFEPLNDKLNLLVADLLWWAETLSAARTLA